CEERLMPVSDKRKEQMLKARAAAVLQKMVDEMDCGEQIIATSGFRSKYEQERIYENSINDNGFDFTAKYVALPGCSEHQTGLAMDISSRSHPDLQPAYAKTANGKWLAEHCWQYGFIIRYPEDKTGVTGIGFEPWHLRYTGLPHSLLIRQQGWCLEEYLGLLKAEGGVTFRDGDGHIWQIDYQGAEDGTIALPIGQPYEWSGDGGAGFIVTTMLE
ncbi:MAG: M15 family metallopeptidase, partial [Clostridiales bacterium]|nr:M15 family metallopeptidase [Clostridiales bacterium]